MIAEIQRRDLFKQCFRCHRRCCPKSCLYRKFYDAGLTRCCAEPLHARPARQQGKQLSNGKRRAGSLTQFLFSQQLRGERFMRRHSRMRNTVSDAHANMNCTRALTCCLKAARTCDLMCRGSDAAGFSAAAWGELQD
jgi:hypothetical protein